MIVAVVALVAAVGGTSYAASKIDSGDVRNDSLKGKDLKADTLGSREVAESKLGEVPSANTAKTATTAADALTLGGEGPAAQKTRWLLLDEDGEIEDQSGGFSIIDAYVTNQNVYIDSGESLVGKGLTASIAIQNQVDVDGMDMDAEPNFAGEVSVTRCQIPGVVECAPPGSKTEDALVVSPRNSDGTATAPGARKRVYVLVTE
jgi:hypothetical protein